MEPANQYKCRECANVSWQEEACHRVPMEQTCDCGSGKFPEECHGEQDKEASESI